VELGSDTPIWHTTDVAFSLASVDGLGHCVGQVLGRVRSSVWATTVYPHTVSGSRGPVEGDGFVRFRDEFLTAQWQSGRCPSAIATVVATGRLGPKPCGNSLNMSSNHTQSTCRARRLGYEPVAPSSWLPGLMADAATAPREVTRW
jgi:hypothetical protein